MNAPVKFDDYEVGYDIPAKPGMGESEIQTPCLVLDLDALERNIKKMGDYAKSHGMRHRVHGKMHKSVDVALLQETAPLHITISCRSEAVTLGAGAASAMGLIVSEFAANSIKHGYPGKTAGHIEIDLSLADGEFHLTCKDDGIGSKSGDMSRPGSLGQTLISAAASQLNGALDTFLTPEGSRLSLTF